MPQSPQAPIGSGFGHGSTAAEVVKSLDLSGKRAVVTGGYSGVGIETVRALVGAGAHVTVPARSMDKAKQALEGLKVDIAAMDLADLASVRRFTSDHIAGGKPLHMLINNAGIMATPETRIGPGWESQLATNHYGHFVLTEGLLPALRKVDGARVVCLSSTAHIRGGIRWDDPHFRRDPYHKWDAYAQSKSANALFAVGLDAREEGNGIRAFAVHPGGILTPLQRHLETEEMVALGWVNPDGTIAEAVRALFKTPEQGGATAAWAATAPKLSGMGGVYCEDCDIAKRATPESQRWEHVRDHAVDPENANRLWEMTVKDIAAG